MPVRKTTPRPVENNTVLPMCNIFACCSGSQVGHRRPYACSLIRHQTCNRLSWVRVQATSGYIPGIFGVVHCWVEHPSRTRKNGKLRILTFCEDSFGGFCGKFPQLCAWRLEACPWKHEPHRTLVLIAPLRTSLEWHSEIRKMPLTTGKIIH